MNRHITFIDELDEHNPLLIDIATRDVICMTTADSVGEAVAVMRKRRISSVVVANADGHPIGIITERNILQVMQEGLPHDTALENTMSLPVITVPPSTTTLEGYQFCLNNGIRHLVIVGDEGEVTGVVSETDSRLHLNLATLAGRRRVASIANRSAIVLPPSSSLQQALDMMLEQRKSCAVAVEEGKPVGIVTERDVVNFYSSDKSYDEVMLGDAMSSPVRTISHEASTSQAAEEMLTSRLRHLVVVDGNGRMTGLLSEHDLTLALEGGLEERRRSIEERFLRTLINTIPDLVWLKDTDGVYLACNARFESFFGAREREIVGKTDYDFVDRETADAFREHDRMAMEADRPTVNEEWITYASDGHRELLETVKTPMRDGNGKLLGVLGVARDVTERKRAEEELHEKEERLALATLHNGVGIWDWNLVTQKMIWDDSMYALYHIRREDFSGTEEAWRASLHPDDLERGDREVEEAIAGIKPFDTEFRVVWPGGEVRHIKAVAEVFRDDKGTPLRMLGTNVDITQRKRLEEQLEQNEHKLHEIYDSVNDCIETISMDGVILDMNRAGYERLGYTREEMVGKELAEFAAPGFAARVVERSAQIVREGKATFESARVCRDGSIMPIEVSSRLIELDGQQVFLGISRDITRRKRTEDALRFIAQRNTGEDAESILAGIVHYLGKTLGVDYALIDRLAEDPGVAETAALYVKGGIAPNMRYELKGTPCDNVIGKNVCCYERNVQEQFPEDTLLVEMEAESYAGIPLWDSAGQPIGLIAVLDGKPFEDEEIVTNLLQLVATRAASELERARGEQLLKAREQQFRTLAENAPVNIVRYGLDYRVTYANPRLLQMLNLEAEEVLDRTLLDLQLEGGDRYEAALRCAMEENSEQHLDMTFPDRKGDPRHYAIQFVPEHDDKGERIGVLAMGSDITERKRNDAVNASRWHLAQFALKHSLDELLEETLNEAEKLTGSLIGFYHFVEDDQVSLTLQNWSKQTKAEFCKAEGKGLHYAIDEAGVWVDCVRERKPVIHNDYASLPHRKGLPEGHAAVIRELVVPVFRGEKITAILGVGNKPTDYTEQDMELVSLLADIAWDIAERKRSEQQLEEYRRRLEGQVAEESTKFRALVEQSLVGIYIIQDGAFRYVNPGMAHIFGYDSPDEIVGKVDIPELVVPEDRQKVADNLSRRLSGGIASMRYNLNGVKRDGTPIVVEVHGSSIEYLGRPAVIGTLVDITEERRSREELLRMAEEKAAELTRKENIYSAVFSQSDSAIELIDPETLRFVEVNDAECRMLGYSRDEMLNMHLMDTQGEMNDTELRAAVAQLPEKSSIRFENRHRCKDGSIIDVGITAGLLDLGKRHLIVAVWNDITERKRVDESLRITASVFETSQEAIVITAPDNTITDVNPAFIRITGYMREEAIGNNPNMLSSGRHDKAFYDAMWQSLQEKDSWRGEIWNRRKNGEIFAELLSISVIRDREGEVLRHVAVFSDISRIKAHEAELSRVAHYDALTGIPNRVLLADRMKQALSRTARERNMMAVCYIDLDAFKPINDNMGHEAGDRVLMEVARRIEGTIRGGDTVARLGGDEFVILLLGLEEAEECVATLKRLLRAIALPIEIGGKTVAVGASIGVSIYPQDDEDADTLLRHADQAMYIAKQAGKHRYHIYDLTHDRRVRDHNAFRDSILHALETEQFELYYQPKVDLKSKRMLGAEALIRWNHPERGLLSPAEFLPAIENSELDIMVGEWVIKTAIAQLDAWRRAGLEIGVSINISACHLESPGFIETLRSRLADYPELPADMLQIEVLETTALEDINIVNGIIDTCRSIGVEFALDDFGTGYSSLTYLSRLPVDVLKIDQFFVRDMLEDKGDMAIIQGVIALAEAFKLQVVAEGVETEAHYRALVELGCEVGQGYGIARPMSARELERWHAE